MLAVAVEVEVVFSTQALRYIFPCTRATEL